MEWCRWYNLHTDVRPPPLRKFSFSRAMQRKQQMLPLPEKQQISQPVESLCKVIPPPLPGTAALSQQNPSFSPSKSRRGKEFLLDLPALLWEEARRVRITLSQLYFIEVFCPLAFTAALLHPNRNRNRNLTYNPLVGSGDVWVAASSTSGFRGKEERLHQQRENPGRRDEERWRPRWWWPR